MHEPKKKKKTSTRPTVRPPSSGARPAYSLQRAIRWHLRKIPASTPTPQSPSLSTCVVVTFRRYLISPSPPILSPHGARSFAASTQSGRHSRSVSSTSSSRRAPGSMISQRTNGRDSLSKKCCAAQCPAGAPSVAAKLYGKLPPALKRLEVTSWAEAPASANRARNLGQPLGLRGSQTRAFITTIGGLRKLERLDVHANVQMTLGRVEAACRAMRVESHLVAS